MKKILSYILVFFVIANLFAPVSVGIKNGQIKISENKISAELSQQDENLRTQTAEQCKASNGDYCAKFRYTIGKNKKMILTGYVIYDTQKTNQGDFGIQGTIKHNNQIIKNLSLDNFNETTPLNHAFSEPKLPGYYGFFLNSETIEDIDPEKSYNISITLSNDDSDVANKKIEIEFNTNPINDEQDVVAGDSNDGTQKSTINPDTILPDCNVVSGKGFMGCLGWGIYYLVFIPTSYLFALAGTFFDEVFAYSINSNSYKSEFVVEGWGIIRDLCNMFFIFILIYAAFGQILGLHGANAKKTIINVVIIGLFINFSLFATQVIIDASNVMAKVFYNSDSISIVKKDSLNASNLVVEEGKPIPLSAAIVNKIDPQIILTQTRNLNLDGGGEDGLTAGAFFIVVIMAIIINLVGIFVFMSVSLIFVARVIGLWLAMIFSPLVFLTYTIPSFQDTEMIGWKKWWPETLKLAFLAPVFIFFLYLILAFMEKGLGVFDADQKTGVEFFVAVLIPFFFIMILLIKAKDIAKDMSGKMGQQITNGIAAAGGLALGVATGGVALAGRKIIGGGLAAMSRTDSAKNYEKKVNQYNKNLKTWKDSGSIGPKPKFKNTVDENGNKIKYNRISGFLGGKLNQKQKDVGHIDHARHEDDEIKKAAGVVDKNGQVLDNSRLTGTDIESMKNKYTQNKRSEAESAIRKGVDGKGKTVSMKDNGNTYTGENDYKSKNRNRVVNEMRDTNRQDYDPNDFDPNGQLSKTGQKKLEDKLNMELNAIVKANVETKISDDFNKMREDSMKSVYPTTRAFSNASRNSYDLRKIADMKSDKRESLFSKVPVALISAVAMGVRTGFKTMGISSNGSNKIEGNFAKDLTNTINEAFKKAKVEVKVDNHGGGHSSANAHGDDHGGGGHGGGGHH